MSIDGDGSGAGAAQPGTDPAKVEATMLADVLKTDRASLMTRTTSFARRVRSRFT